MSSLARRLTKLERLAARAHTDVIWAEQQCAVARALRDDGKTFREIGEILDVTAEKARRMYRASLRTPQSPDHFGEAVRVAERAIKAESAKTPAIKIEDDLTVLIGDASVRLTPSEGLDFAEQLARKAFRRALIEEVPLARLDQLDMAGQA